MTFQRVLHRNNLFEGDYQSLPEMFTRPNLVPNRDPTDHEIKHLALLWREQCLRAEQFVKSLCGDLRRLEKDAQDENNICTVIAMRTGVHVDDVAAVLQEFITT